MQPHEPMTTEMVAVTPYISITEIARILLQRGISAAPVADNSGAPLGMVSDGDLIGHNNADRIARRDWRLTLLAQDVMVSPLVSISETADAEDFALPLRERRIKRVQGLRDGRLVGIFSRADLLRAILGQARQPDRQQSHAVIA